MEKQRIRTPPSPGQFRLRAPQFYGYALKALQAARILGKDKGKVQFLLGAPVSPDLAQVAERHLDKVKVGASIASVGTKLVVDFLGSKLLGLNWH